jgi:hypothetical protein
MAQLFYAYATADARHRDQLERHLRALKQRGVLSGWDSLAVGPGSKWRGESSPQAKKADVVLLLMSSDLIASGYTVSADVNVALERHRNGAARLIPVLLRPFNTKSTPLAMLPALPRGGKPVTRWSDAEAAFESIAAGIAAPLIAPVHEAEHERPASESQLAEGAAAGASATVAFATGAAAAAGTGAAAMAAPAVSSNGAAGGAAPTGTPGEADPPPARVALQPDEIGPEFVAVDQAKGREEGAKFVSMARAKSRGVAQLVFRANSPQDALNRLKAAIQAEVSKGGRAEPVEPGLGAAAQRVTAGGSPAPQVSVFAAKGRFLVAVKVIGGSGPGSPPGADQAALAESVVSRMLARVPERPGAAQPV